VISQSTFCSLRSANGLQEAGAAAVGRCLSALTSLVEIDLS
jgi:hypothetical protein